MPPGENLCTLMLIGIKKQIDSGIFAGVGSCFLAARLRSPLLLSYARVLCHLDTALC